MVYFSTAIIVSGGEADEMSKLRSVEVLHSDGSPWCSLPDLPRSRSHHSQTGLEACGGTTSDYASYDDEDYNPDSDSTDVTCVHFNGGWNHSQTLQRYRESHCSWASPAGTLIIGGGLGEDTETTELLNHTTGDSALHFPLKFDIS